MGAQFNVMTLRGGPMQVEREFEKEQQEDIRENGDSYSGGFGMARGLHLTSLRFKTDVDADAWLVERAQKWEEALAVKVDDPDGNFHWRIGAWCSS